MIQGNGGGVSVGILENGDWQGKIEMTGEYCGVVVVTAPGQPGKAAVIVILNDEQGQGLDLFFEFNGIIENNNEMYFYFAHIGSLLWRMLRE